MMGQAVVTRFRAPGALYGNNSLFLTTSTLLLGVVLIAHSLATASTTLLAGAAKNTITPDVANRTVYLAGFGHNRIATGVHDPLFVRCLSLQIADEGVVFCSADLIGLFYDDVQAIRRIFAKEVPIGFHLVVACTHTHEGPDTLGLYGPSAAESGADKKYLAFVQERVAATAVEAVRAMRPARMHLARDDGAVLGTLQSVDRPPYVKDPHLFVMSLSSVADGKTIATLVNWSDHPEILGRKNTEISADYPRWICQYVEKHRGGTALFFNAAPGKVSALGSEVALLDPDTGKPAEDGTWRKAELLGELIGKLADEALRRSEAVSPDRLSVRSAVIFVPLSNMRFREAEGTGIFLGRKPLFTHGKLDASIAELPVGAGQGTVRYATGLDLESEVDYITLQRQGRPIAEFVTIPGEAYPELINGGVTRYPGADYPDAPLERPVRSVLRSKYQFVLGLGNDELGYLIPKAEWDEHPPWLRNNPEPYYGEINSVGIEAAGAVSRAVQELANQAAAR